jgi:hypothetical protein
MAIGRKLDLNPSINFLFQNAFAKQLQGTRKEHVSLYQLRTSGHKTDKTKRATGQGFAQNIDFISQLFGRSPPFPKTDDTAVLRSTGLRGFTYVSILLAA